MEADRISLSVEEVSALDRAEDLSGEWTELLSRAVEPEPFLTPEWCLAWWRAFGAGTMKLLVVRDGSRMVGLAPLRVVPERQGPFERRTLRFWSNLNSNRISLVLDREDAEVAIDRLVGALFEGEPDWDVARLGHVIRDSEVMRLLSAVLDRRKVRWGTVLTFSSPYLPLHPSPEELESALSGSFRRTLRRKERKAEQAGGLLAYVSRGDGGAIDKVFTISSTTWQNREGTGIGSTPALEQFYRELATVAKARGWLRLGILEIDGTPVAFEYNLVFDGIMYNLKLGFDPGSGHVSPGILLKMHVLREAIASGTTEYDMLGAAEPYKLQWTDRARPLASIWMHRRGVAGLLVHTWVLRLRPALLSAMPWLRGLRRKANELAQGDGS
jgi:CelD/BcsL family acetyltransferase involved in cellulose biosynthesis